MIKLTFVNRIAKHTFPPRQVREIRLPVTQPPPTEIPPPATKPIDDVPRDMKVARWLRRRITEPGFVMREIVRPGRIGRALLCWFTIYARVRLFATAMLGPRLGDDAYAERMRICGGCRFRVERRGRLRRLLRLDGEFCGVCGCWSWWLAELHRKNRHAKAYCPKRLHPGRYPSWVGHGGNCAGCGTAARVAGSADRATRDRRGD